MPGGRDRWITRHTAAGEIPGNGGGCRSRNPVHIPTHNGSVRDTSQGAGAPPSWPRS
ncbi:hypothetical protein SXIM_17780 [Streptomyces xiamenensis]|uniref:Uncharacterized protein n=1 Tax=Streptomyces xiamenensis TaxID=408015 RepID=A0A0F7FSK4_9ACTN|nr:hypothetical protein SXIM_17780 [Streptomyces xiamenensis]